MERGIFYDNQLQNGNCSQVNIKMDLNCREENNKTSDSKKSIKFIQLILHFYFIVLVLYRLLTINVKKKIETINPIGSFIHRNGAIFSVLIFRMLVFNLFEFLSIFGLCLMFCNFAYRSFEGLFHLYSFGHFCFKDIIYI